MGDNHSTIDKQFLNDLQPLLNEKETIEWTGKSHPKFSITFLEMGNHYDAVSGASNIPGFIFGMVAAGVIFSYVEGYLWGIFLSIGLGLLLFLLPDIVKHQRKKNTRYAFSKKQLFFQLWWWGKKELHTIPLSDIQKISTEEYKNGKGVIHFISNKMFDFHTYDFITSEKQTHPTFENIPNVIEVAQKIERFRKL